METDPSLEHLGLVARRGSKGTGAPFSLGSSILAEHPGAYARHFRAGILPAAHSSRSFLNQWPAGDQSGCSEGLS